MKHTIKIDDLTPAPPLKLWSQIFYRACWFVAERFVLFWFGAECRRAKAEYSRGKLAAWVDEMPVQPLEPVEKALGYQQKVKLEYAVQHLEKCLAVEAEK